MPFSVHRTTMAKMQEPKEGLGSRRRVRLMNTVKACTLILALLLSSQIAHFPMGSSGIPGSQNVRGTTIHSGSASSPAIDFSLSSSGGIAVVQGGSGSNTISGTLVSGTSQSVNLVVSGYPPLDLTPQFTGMGCNGLATCMVPPTFSVTLTFSASSSASPNQYVITVTASGSGGELTDTTQFTVTVSSAGFDFALSNSGNIAVSQGGSGSNMINGGLVSGT